MATTKNEIKNKKNKAKTKSKNAFSSAVVRTLNIQISKPARYAILIIVCIVFVCVFLYQPAKDYYQSVRDIDKLQARHDALQQTITELENDIEFSQTNEGVIEKAKENLGLIEQGLSTGVVSGLDTDTEEGSSASSSSSRLAYKNIKAPETWYSPFFDWFFDYQG